MWTTNAGVCGQLAEGAKYKTLCSSLFQEWTSLHIKIQIRSSNAIIRSLRIIKNLETVSPQPAKNSRFEVKTLVLTAVGLGLVTTASGFPEQPLIFIAGAALLVLAVFSNKHQ